jgi:hypothetical protein
VPEKLYASLDTYEKKLYRVMERFGIPKKDVNWDCNRFECYVEFRYKGQLYRFDHSVAKAKANGINVSYGSDAFAQLVLTLEDLARAVERKLYDLSTWISGMKMLPAPTQIPDCIKLLGFTEIPASVEEVKVRYRSLCKVHHPDQGGTEEGFKALMKAAEDAEAWLGARSGAEVKTSA